MILETHTKTQNLDFLSSILLSSPTLLAGILLPPVTLLSSSTRPSRCSLSITTAAIEIPFTHLNIRSLCWESRFRASTHRSPPPAVAVGADSLKFRITHTQSREVCVCVLWPGLSISLLPSRFY